jgi:acyl-homoserine-lactone acylase
MANLCAVVNTIAADRHGDALYADISIVPDVDSSLLQRCAPGKAAAGLFAGAGRAILDGSKSDCDWARDRLSPVPGLTPPARLPALVRRDWVQNSNDSFWLSNPKQRLTGFSPLVGPVDNPQDMRTRAGIKALTERLDGAASSRKLTLGDPVAMLLQNRNHTASIVLDDLIAACPEAPTPDTKEARGVLAWDRMNNLDLARQPSVSRMVAQCARHAESPARAVRSRRPGQHAPG